MGWAWQHELALGGWPVTGWAVWIGPHRVGRKVRGGRREQAARAGQRPQGSGPGGGPVPLRAHPGRPRAGVEYQAARSAGSSIGRPRSSRSVRQAGARLPRHLGPLDPRLPQRRVRRAGPGASAGPGRHPGGCAGAGGGPQEGGAGSDRRAGRGRAGRARRVRTLGPHAATRLLRRWSDPGPVALVRHWRCSAASKPTDPTCAGSATRCTALRSRAAKRS